MPPRRVLFKLSGARLSDKDSLVNRPVINEIVEGIGSAKNQTGVQVAIMVGGGNILRGSEAPEMNRDRADQAGMLATLINAVILEEALDRAGLNPRLFSSLDVPDVCRKYNRQVVDAKLNKGHIVVLGGGMGETRFTTDTAAAQRAANLDCDLLVKGTHTFNGVYDRDPAVYPEAERFDDLSFDELVTRRLRVMDLTSITHCRENGINVRVFLQDSAHHLAQALTGEPVGTLVHP